MFRIVAVKNDGLKKRTVATLDSVTELMKYADEVSVEKKTPWDDVCKEFSDDTVAQAKALIERCLSDRMESFMVEDDLYHEIKNNVYHADMVVENEDGTRYAVFEEDWNGEYYEATACTADGSLINGETTRLYPVDVEVDEDTWERVGYEKR